jgi:hypothetical protein
MPRVAVAFALPDITTDTADLRARLMAYIVRKGVRIRSGAGYVLTFDGARACFADRTDSDATDTIVLCAGAAAPSVLDRACIGHGLVLSHLPYGYLPGECHLPLTYWLDDDLLAVSPTAGGVRAALPGRSRTADGSSAEHGRLRGSLRRHWPALASDGLVHRCGTVCELRGSDPDPSAQVIDMRARRAGWSRVENLIACLPGKWTTAWQAADRVAALLGSGA